MTDILLIEDTLDIGTLLCDFLRQAGYSCHHATSGEDGLDYLDHSDTRLVLLDIMLPGIDGFQVCQKIHKEKNLPLILISAMTDKEDKLNGLTLGADDYIEKPFDIDLVIAKVNALYRRYYSELSKGSKLHCGNIIIDTTARTVSLDNNILNLTIKEYELLLLMMKNKDKVLQKDYIFNQVWGYDSFSEPSTLTVHIKWLREKIEKDSKNPEYISTVWGVGYKFNDLESSQ